MRPAIKVGLSTASVYPLKAEAAFESAAELGYDGVELMVWSESVSQDIGAVSQLSRRYDMPVLSVHAPCLLISQRVWGADPIEKLTRSVQAAERLGAQTVVVHPPFRWQRRYAEGFSEQVAWLEERSDVMVAVENMFPFRTDRFFGAGQQSIDRMRRRGGHPGAGISAFAPSYDPLDGNHAHYTLDLSHTATAGTDALDMARREMRLMPVSFSGSISGSSRPKVGQAPWLAGSSCTQRNSRAFGYRSRVSPSRRLGSGANCSMRTIAMSSRPSLDLRASSS